MNDSLKNVLGWVGVLAISTFAISAAVFVFAYAKASQPTSYRTFVVSADAKASVTPDVAMYTFSIMTDGGTDVGKVRDENISKTNKVIDFVKSQGIPAEDISTQIFQLNPRYQYCDYSIRGTCPPPEIVGYSMQQTVQIKIRDFTKISALLTGTISNGANNVSELRFIVDDPASTQQEAREKAITKAKVKAQAMAQAGGFRVGRLISIYESPTYGQPYLAYGMGGSGMEKDAAPAPTIEPGSQDVSITVNLTYEIL